MFYSFVPTVILWRASELCEKSVTNTLNYLKTQNPT